MRPGQVATGKRHITGGSRADSLVICVAPDLYVEIWAETTHDGRRVGRHAGMSGVEDRDDLVPAYLLEMSEPIARDVIRAWRGWMRPEITKLADALEEQLPPRPPEPHGLGASVELVEGGTAVRVDGGLWVTRGGKLFGWEELNVLKVLGQGVLR